MVGVTRLSILGSTGSVGTQALDVVAAYPDQFEIVGLSAGKNLDVIQQQVRQFSPQYVSVATEELALQLSNFCDLHGIKVDIFFGSDGLEKIATLSQPDMVLVAICGTAAIYPTYLAIENGSHIALASKEVLVSAGSIIMPAAAHMNVAILPVDSEHAAIHQCLRASEGRVSEVASITLTASGGPFRELPLDQFSTITKAQALRHPNWSMGSKITLDSATLMNKGLEVIEAHHLFSMSFDQIKVVVHPQSIMHCLLEFCDGNVLAHLGCHDMHFAIQYALTYPNRYPNMWPKLDLTRVGRLDFFEPDYQKFPLLKLAFDVGAAEGILPAVMNAANEAAVHMFLTDQVSFIQMTDTVLSMVEKTTNFQPASIDEIVAVDRDIKQQLHYEYC